MYLSNMTEFLIAATTASIMVFGGKENIRKSLNLFGFGEIGAQGRPEKRLRSKIRR